MKLHNTYMFRDKDPGIDALRGAFQRAKVSRAEIAIKSNVSPSTYYGWFDGKVRRPQFCKLVATARAIGPEGIKALQRVIERGK